MSASLRFAANLSTLWTDLPLEMRARRAAAAGFREVEILFPYDENAAQLARLLKRLSLSVALINGPPPNYTGGERGFAAIPGREGRFRSDFRRALRYAKALGARAIHVMAGPAEGAEAEETFVANLHHAAEAAPDRLLTIEPLNPGDAPGYFLSDYDRAARILEAVDRPNVALQFDAYHAQIITGDLLGAWDRHGARAAHVQIADAPGRGAPGTGRAPLGAFLDRLAAEGFAGAVAAEYRAEGDVEATLGWRAGR